LIILLILSPSNNSTFNNSSTNNLTKPFPPSLSKTISAIFLTILCESEGATEYPTYDIAR